MAGREALPIGIRISSDIEVREDRPSPYRARVRWTDSKTKKRQSRSEAFTSRPAAEKWIQTLEGAAQTGIDPAQATQTLEEYGEHAMGLALRGLEAKTIDLYQTCWRLRVIPTLGHLSVKMVSNGAVDRAVHAWIAEDCSRSIVKNTVAVLVRVMEQATRDGIIDRNPARVSGWQREFKKS